MNLKACAVLLSLSASAVAAELPNDGFAGLEKLGAVIGVVHVDTRNIFDPTHPEETYALYGWVNRAHVVTRPAVIERMLLFHSGEKVSRQKINETERLLRTLRIIHDVEIKPTRYEDGVVDIEVITRDTWSLDLGGSFSRAGGQNKARVGIRERNLLGTGIGLSYGRSSDADRSGNELELAYNQALDGWTRLFFGRGRFSDGRRTAYEIDRPFYSLDTRWAARGAWTDDSRIDPIYNAGNVVSEYRHHSRAADVFAGWSPGLVKNWTSRFLAGALVRDDSYAVEPGRVLAFPLPIDHEVRAPFVRYELLEDEFVKVTNYNRIQRPEFLGLGFASYLQLARSLAAGSTPSEWLYAAGASDGKTFHSGSKLLGRATIERRIGSTATALTQGSLTTQLYVPWRSDALFYAGASADHVSGGGVADELLLGGDTGLRGYPSRYQSGQNRVLLSAEQRIYSNWYPLRLARVGGAVFFDTGRAWRGVNPNLENGGWLSDVGVGLRLALDRSAFDNVLHVDLAVPLNRTPEIKAVQFLVKTYVSF